MEMKNPETPTSIYIMRHGERMDNCFGNWVSTCISDSGTYLRTDLNMPVTLPKRHGYPHSFVRDTPLTNVGTYIAKLKGEAFLQSGIKIRHVFCSPALRCVQTCHNVLTGLGVADKLPMKIEHGLIEWLKFYISEFPQWMYNEELAATGYNIEKDYKSYLNRDNLKSDLKETGAEYYDRTFQVMQHILKQTSQSGGGNILIVAHSWSLDGCSRLLCGQQARSEAVMDKLNLLTPYCGLVKVQRQNNQWQLGDCEVPCVSYLLNKSFDWRVFLSDHE